MHVQNYLEKLCLFTIVIHEHKKKILLQSYTYENVNLNRV
jgi:hypothetical protein